MKAQLTNSPYRGLTPYARDDWEYFFGRDKDVERLTAYLGSSTLTVLYGASGVGKSSLLRAGLEHRLLERGRQNVSEGGPPRVLVGLVREWQRDPSAAVLDALAAAWKETGAKRPSIGNGTFTGAVGAWATAAGGAVYLVLDQFEEYFLYHAKDGGIGEFGKELAQIVNNRRSPVSVMLVLREDAVTQLDRFKSWVPSLLNRYLRVEHLSFDAARDAIVRPLEVYAKRTERGPSSVDPELCETILREVRAGPSERVEAPYLQLIMQRVWQDAVDTGAEVIERDALRRLGGTALIAREHVDVAMTQLSPSEQDAAATIFHQLVTPSGSKIAHTVEDLAAWSTLPVHALTPILRALSEGETRILRSVPPPLDRPFSSSYELFHDVLARPVLDWCASHEQARATGRLRPPRPETPSLEWSGHADGVFAAGGIRLIALAGALRGFAMHPVFPICGWDNVAGVSGGALIAALVACGYSADEIGELVAGADFAKVLGPAPSLLRAISLVSRGSLSSGRALESWLDRLLAKRTFADVRSAGVGYRLRLVAADIAQSTMLILPDDLPSYRLPGESAPIDPDEFPLALAVRMSMSIPFVFPPVELVHAQTGQTASIIDGGIFSELPIWLFDLAEGPVQRPTFGMRVRGARGAGSTAGAGFGPRPMRLALQVFRASSEAADARFIARSARSRTCVVDGGSVGTTDFGLSPEKKQVLLESGTADALSFLDQFDVFKYVNVYGRTFTSVDPSPT